MPKTSVRPDTIPHAVEAALRRLGSNIAIARKRRGMKQAELAGKTGVTHVTLRRVERGSPTTSIGAYFAAVWALGLETELGDLASPDRDEVGKQRELGRLAQRIRSTAGASLSGDF